MKYYVIAGESSGDMHGAWLTESIKKTDPQAVFRGWGGDRMHASGVNLCKHIRETSVMGILDVLANLRTLLGHLALCKRDILTERPDVVILIDYPGFNLKIAKFAFENDIKCVYYIPPKVWVWKSKRVYKLKKYCTAILTIFPFEKEFYNRYQTESYFVGNPLADQISPDRLQKRSDLETRYNMDPTKTRVALFPGSRPSEIKSMMPTMMRLAVSYPEKNFLIAGMWLSKELLSQYDIPENVSIFYEKNYEVFTLADVAIINSGTASLEACLHQVPQVVCYTLDKLSIFVLSIAIKKSSRRFISLVNIIAQKEVVKELLQGEFTFENLKNEFENLNRKDYRNTMMREYQSVRKALSTTDDGRATEKAAQKIYDICRVPN